MFEATKQEHITLPQMKLKRYSKELVLH